MIVRRLPMLAISVGALAVIGAAARDTPSPTPAVFATPVAAVDARRPAGRRPDQQLVLPRRAGLRRGGLGWSDRDRQLGAPSPSRRRSPCSPGPATPSSSGHRRRRSIRSASTLDASVTTPVRQRRRRDRRRRRPRRAAGDAAAPARRWRRAPTPRPRTGTSPKGFTAEDSTEQLVLTNPFDESRHRRHRVRHERGLAQPAELQGFPVRPRSVTVIDLDAIAARDEPEVAIKVVATRGGADRRPGPALRRRGPAAATAMSPRRAGAARPVVVRRRGQGARRHRALQHLQPERRRRRGAAGVPRRATETVPVEPIAVPARQVVTSRPPTSPACPTAATPWCSPPTPTTRSSSSGSITRTIDGHPDDIGAARRAVPTRGRLTWPTRGRWRSDRASRPRTRSSCTTSTPPTPRSPCRRSPPEGLVTVPSLADSPLPANGLITIALTEPEVLGQPARRPRRRRRCSSSVRCPASRGPGS